MRKIYSVILLFLATLLHAALSDGLVAEYRMDECYWLDHSVEKSVKEKINGLDGAVFNGAQTYRDQKVVGLSSGAFDGDTHKQYVEVDSDAKLNMTSAMTVAFWVYPTTYNSAQTNFLVVKRAQKKGWGTRYYHITHKVEFFVKVWNKWPTAGVSVPSNWLNHWHFVVGRYDGTDVSVRLIDDQNDLNNSVTKAGTINIAGNMPLRMAYNYYRKQDGDYFAGYLDEVKIWNRALSDTEITTIYNNEKAGKNFDGTDRAPVECNATIAANTWELVGIPADFRNPNNTKKTVADIFGDDMGGTYGTDWRMYRRDYSTTDNNSSYTYLNLNDTLEFGKGYWLGSKIDGSWSENGAATVDYDSTHAACTAARCVEIDLTGVTHDYDDGTGPYRYNMSGFVGKTPIRWADCRFLIDGTAYTPSDAEAAGYAAKQIWLYNPGSGANSNGYTTCDDTMTTCLLEPYHGFWVELHGPTMGKTVKLLIPKE